MISKLPKWGWAGGAILAFCGGMINAIALLGFSHQAATHVTGLFSKFSIYLEAGDWPSALLYFYPILFYFLGAVICGLVIKEPSFEVGRRYGIALGLESAFLFLAAYGFSRNLAFGSYLASLAAGLQNALVSNFSGTVVRTTHLTGIVTDLGVACGHFMKGVKTDVELRKILLFMVLILSFIAGGLAGTGAYHAWSALAMLGPAVITAVLSAGYGFLRKRITPHK